MRPERRSGAPRGEDGTVVILYSVAMLMFIGLLALVLDAGALRYDARNTQSVADMAVVAGAADLHEAVDGNPQKACETAWGYVLNNIGESEQQSPCFDDTGLPLFNSPTSDLMAACRADPTMATIEGFGWTENYQAEVYWPVPEGDLLDDRYDPDVDGESPCDRIAVKVFRARGFVFGGAIGGGAGALVGSPAVARANAEEEGTQAPTLVVLDDTGKASLCATGQGGVWVHESSVEGGAFMVIDSDGSAPGNCESEAGPAAIWAKGKGQIKAGVAFGDDTGTVVPDAGRIFSYALLVDPSNSNGWREQGGDAVIDPEPVPGERVTRAPVDEQYGEAIADVMATLGGSPGTPPGSSTAWGGSWERYTTYVSANFPTVTNPCHLNSAVVVTIPAGNWWIDCPNPAGLAIEADSKLLIPGSGNVVFDGTVDVRKGELSINNTVGNGDNLVFFRTGASLLRSGNNTAVRFGRVFDATLEGPMGHRTCDDGADNDGDTLIDEADSGCQVQYPGTTVVLQDGVAHVAGGSTAVLEWAAPWQKDPEGDTTLDQGDLHALALWAERTTPITKCTTKPTDPPIECFYLSGGANLGLYGVFFAPNSSPFTFAGQGLMAQQRAQFWTWRLLARGTGFLRMEPDPDFVDVKYDLNVRLIR